MEKKIVLEQDEVKLLQEMLKPLREKLLKKREKYIDIHEGGEATARQETTLTQIENRLFLIDKFF